MEYRHVVTYLADFYGISPEDMARFKARLHCLRKMGIPKGVDVGKGTRAKFCAACVEEMHIGYSLMLHGFTPERILDVIQYIRGVSYWIPLTQWTDHFLIVTRQNEKQRVAIKSCDTSFDYLKKMSRWNGAPTCSSVLRLRDIAEGMRRFYELHAMHKCAA